MKTSKDLTFKNAIKESARPARFIAAKATPSLSAILAGHSSEMNLGDYQDHLLSPIPAIAFAALRGVS